jgi:nitric oxide reductase large subunit
MIADFKWYTVHVHVICYYYDIIIIPKISMLLFSINFVNTSLTSLPT